jgi:hypothetical protein
MSFLGTGSDWFWLALTALVLAGTGVAVFREVRLQTSAHAREQLFAIGDQWYSERFLRMKLEVYRTIRAGGTAAEAPRHAVINLCNFWEKFGALTQGGHIRSELMFEYETPIMSWWIMAEPVISRALRLAGREDQTRSPPSAASLSLRNQSATRCWIGGSRCTRDRSVSRKRCERSPS